MKKNNNITVRVEDGMLDEIERIYHEMLSDGSGIARGACIRRILTLGIATWDDAHPVTPKT